uniref:Anaphase-promoting complex subunit 4 WD40 domain-containing protein n=1 Tax=Arcella intermedia TaxID=1963864 RepID=A0A6B2LC50_9EUKA
MVHYGEAVTCCSLSKDDTLLVSGGQNFLTLFNIESSDNTLKIGTAHLFQGETGISSVTFSYDSRFFLSSSLDKAIKIWETVEKECYKTFEDAHSNEIPCVAISTDNRMIWSCSKDQTLKLWNSLGCVKYTVKEEDPVNHLEVRSDVVYYSHGNKVSAFQSIYGDYSSNLLYTGKEDIVHIGLCPSGQTLFFVESKSVLTALDVSSKAVLYKIQLDSAIHCLAVHPTRMEIAVGNENGIVLLDISSKTITKNTLAYGTISCHCLNWDSQGRYLISGFKDGFIRVWK